MLSAMQRETERRLHPRPRPADPGRDPGHRPADHLHRRLSRGDRGRRRRALRVHPRGQVRAPGRLPLLPGGGNPRGQDGRPGPREGEGAPLAPPDGAPEGDRRVGQRAERRDDREGTGRRARRRPRRGRRARHRRPRVRAPRACRSAASRIVTINGHHDYDLLALPAGERPAEFKVARQAQ